MGYIITLEKDTSKLFKAIDQKNDECVEKWLELGHNPNMSFKKELPLSRCILKNYLEGACLLALHGANVNGKNWRKLSHVGEALFHQRIDIANALLSFGAKPTSKDLNQAIKNRHYDIVNFFLSLNVSIGSESIAYLLELNAPELAESLLSGSNINQETIQQLLKEQKY